MPEDREKLIFSQNLNYYISKSGKTQTEIADTLNVGLSTFNSWRLGNRMPRMAKVQSLADYFGINKSDLIEEKPLIDKVNIRENDLDIFKFGNIFPIETKKIPFLGEIACGEPIFADELRDSYIIAGTGVHADFCLCAKGDSMINARIHDGDIVFIRKQNSVDNGQIAAVIIDDSATLKRVTYHPERNMIILRAENPAFNDIIYMGDELEQVRILGLAIAFQSDVS